MALDYKKEYKKFLSAAKTAADYYHSADKFSFGTGKNHPNDQNGALLVFDEVIAGFRLTKGGAQEYFNGKADLDLSKKGTKYIGSLVVPFFTGDAVESFTDDDIEKTVRAKKAVFLDFDSMFYKTCTNFFRLYAFFY